MRLPGSLRLRKGKLNTIGRLRILLSFKNVSQMRVVQGREELHSFELCDRVPSQMSLHSLKSHESRHVVCGMSIAQSLHVFSPRFSIHTTFQISDLKVGSEVGRKKSVLWPRCAQARILNESG